MFNGSRDELSTVLRSERIRSELRGYIVRPGRGPYADFTHLLALSSGAVDLLVGGEEHRLAAGSVAVLPSSTDITVAISAGSAGWIVGAAPVLMAEAIGAAAESAVLRVLSVDLTIIQFDDDHYATEIDPILRLLQREVARPGRGSQMAAGACLRLMLVALWREGHFEAGPEGGETSPREIVTAFRRQVELHFRRHIAVTDYADRLGISYDRLHAICTRTLGRSPLQLVHQRLMREAAGRLQRSAVTIQQIAYELGFADESRFSHFFKAKSGLSPRDYRKTSRLSAQRSAAPEPQSFADWP